MNVAPQRLERRRGLIYQAFLCGFLIAAVWNQWFFKALLPHLTAHNFCQTSRFAVSSRYFLANSSLGY
jgi:hypothetical protein